MKIQITLHCPNCQSTDVKKNGNKANGKQNYQCKSCGRQFTGDYVLQYKGWHSCLIHKILLMLVRGIGIRDIAEIEGVSIEVLSVWYWLAISPKPTHCDCLEAGEFWTYARKKKNKVWLIYAYHRVTGEIVAYVLGKRNLKTAQLLRQKISGMRLHFDSICADNRDSFINAFQHNNHIIGKIRTVGIEENNCRLRHRIRRAFRKTCCFSKKLYNHFKVFELVFFYISKSS